MSRRFYFILPNVASAEQTLRDLLRARIEVKRIHLPRQARHASR
jgi:hypothetical protein